MIICFSDHRGWNTDQRFERHSDKTGRFWSHCRIHDFCLQVEILHLLPSYVGVVAWNSYAKMEWNGSVGWRRRTGSSRGGARQEGAVLIKSFNLSLTRHDWWNSSQGCCQCSVHLSWLSLEASAAIERWILGYRWHRWNAHYRLTLGPLGEELVGNRKSVAWKPEKMITGSHQPNQQQPPNRQQPSNRPRKSTGYLDNGQARRTHYILFLYTFFL